MSVLLNGKQIDAVSWESLSFAKAVKDGTEYPFYTSLKYGWASAVGSPPDAWYQMPSHLVLNYPQEGVFCLASTGTAIQSIDGYGGSSMPSYDDMWISHGQPDFWRVFLASQYDYTKGNSTTITFADGSKRTVKWAISGLTVTIDII